MHYGIDVINFGEYGDPRTTAHLAHVAEEAGWDGLFVWDHLAFVWGMNSGDPWILLAAAAMTTTRLRLGTAVTPVPRRRPHVLAETLKTIDRMTNGRMVLGVGIGGVVEEYTAFGEPGEAKTRAAMLDESLEVLNQLWSGEPVTHHGAHYRVEGVTLRPPPVQRPRIPIWVGGNSRGAMCRAARWDGWLPDSANETQIVKTPEQLAADLTFVRQQRTTSTPFDVAFIGYSTTADQALVKEYADAGATWWLESLHGLRGSFDEMLSRVQAGPPRA